MVQTQSGEHPSISRREVLQQECCPVAVGPVQAERAKQAAPLLRALADETRLQMLWLLARQPDPLCVCYIEAAFSLSQPTISHHLKVLREAGLVQAERRGVWIYYSVDREAAGRLKDLLSLPDSSDCGEGESP